MKTFLSIGTGPGIGLATAERFGREGYRVIVSARSAGKTRSLADQLSAQGSQAHGMNVDASDTSEVVGLIEGTLREHGRIDVVHYNAAAIKKASVEDQLAADFHADLAVNIGGALTAIQAAWPHMSERGSGSILLTGGALADYPHPDYLTLSIGKAGLRALGRALFEDFKERGVHIATVTVSTAVEPNSKEAQAVAERFWSLHNEDANSWTYEMAYPQPEL